MYKPIQGAPPAATELAFQAYVQREPDVADAVRHVRQLAERLGFSHVDCSYLATAASELATNLVIHAGGGSFLIFTDRSEGLIELSTRDAGPGIADIPLALTDGFSTSGGLGCGLPGVKRLMDGLEIESTTGEGTNIRAWKKR